MTAETLAQRTDRMRREAATAAQAETRRQAALDATLAAPRTSPDTKKAGVVAERGGDVAEYMAPAEIDAMLKAHPLPPVTLAPETADAWLVTPSPAPSIIPSSAAPAAVHPAPAIVDPGAVRQAKERPMSDPTQAPLKRTTVKLSSPILWFNKLIEEVTLREPTAAVFFKIGEPTVWAGHGGTAVLADVPEAIRAYLDHCLVDVDSGSNILTVLSLRDGFAIKEALMGFFRRGTEAAPA